MHFASYKGHLDAILALLEAGADRFCLTATQLNMLHVAAQGDSAASLFVFKELGLDINSTDRRGSSPLHWAVFRQSEIALSYLLAWEPDLNQ
jgi:ankyrin repeat protein